MPTLPGRARAVPTAQAANRRLIAPSAAVAATIATATVASSPATAVAAGASALAAVAIAAVDRPIAAWLKWHLGWPAAGAADYLVQLAAPGISTGGAAGETVAAPRGAAGRAALWLISEAALSVVGLVLGREGERLPALDAGQLPVLITHRGELPFAPWVTLGSGELRQRRDRTTTGRQPSFPTPRLTV